MWCKNPSCLIVMLFKGFHIFFKVLITSLILGEENFLVGQWQRCLAMCASLRTDRVLPFNDLRLVFLMHVGSCVCVCRRVCSAYLFVLRAFLAVRLQMLSSAHLGWNWAVRCERGHQQQDVNEEKALSSVVTCLWVYSFLTTGKNCQWSCVWAKYCNALFPSY